MMKKILALLLVLLMSVALFACNEEPGETETTDGTINIGGEETSAQTGEEGSEIESGSTNVKIGDPGDYNYTDCDQVVYVNNPDSAVTLRSEDYVSMGSIAHGTELRRIGLSTDAANYWSKVLYKEKEYYVASKFLTTIKNPDEGFVEVSKTVVVNKQTGSLNIRNLPTLDGSAVIGWAHAGVETKVVAENTATGWYKVEFIPHGSTEVAYGYMRSSADYYVADSTATEATTTEAATEAPTEAATEAATQPEAGK